MYLGTRQTREEQGELSPFEADGSFMGQIMERPKEELLTYLTAFNESSLFTTRDGKRYRVTEFLSNGQFKAVPDWKD